MAASIRVMRFSTKSRQTATYLQRQAKDEYARKAREHDYRARSAFKLAEIDDKYKFLLPGTAVIDVGAAPGSWSQVVLERTNPVETGGLLVSVDLQLIKPLKGAVVLSEMDITSRATRAEIRRVFGDRLVDCVLSDMAPSPTGSPSVDHERILKLVRSAISLFTGPSSVLRPASRFTFLCKIWDGQDRISFMKELSEEFSTLKMVWRNAAKVVAAAVEAVGRAFTRAVREELRTSSQAAQRQADRTGQSQSEAKQAGNTNAKLGISLQEAVQILNAREPLELEDIQKKYEHLFKINDKSTGGSFYLQAKVFRAKERIDEELRRQGINVETKEPQTESKETERKES